MSIDQIMQTDPIACLPSESLNEAARVMWEHDCGFVPIIASHDERRVVGVITDRDICMCAYTRGTDLKSLRIADAMCHVVYTCSVDDTLEAAERIMQQGQVRRLPVVDANARLVGVLSLSDLARRAAQSGGTRRRRGEPSKSDVGELLGSISQPRALPSAIASA